jgi:endonuclease IV
MLCVFDREKRKKSYECFVDELRRCEKLGLRLYNFQSVAFTLFNKPRRHVL